jgi:hypothetical protein
MNFELLVILCHKWKGDTDGRCDEDDKDGGNVPCMVNIGRGHPRTRIFHVLKLASDGLNGLLVAIKYLLFLHILPEARLDEIAEGTFAAHDYLFAGRGCFIME